LTFTPLEIAAVIFTLANVWLAVKENIWTWPTGIASVLLYLVVFWRSHLYLNAGLQLVYFALSIHGWYEWLHGGENKTELKITRASDGQVVFRLSGRMSAENVGELETQIRAEASGRRIILDLKDLTLVDRDVVGFLRRCEAENIQLTNCPAYIREWMGNERQ